MEKNKMGTEYNLGGNTSYIELSKEFVKENLTTVFFQAPFNYNSEFFIISYKPIETNIKCCKCLEGTLQLTNKKKDICEVHVCHNGNSYNLKCNKCNFRYVYREQWLFC